MIATGSLRQKLLDLAVSGKLVPRMGKWRELKLSEACSLIADCPHTTAPDEGSGIPLIRTPNIGFGRLVLDGVHRVSESVYKERVSRGVPEPGNLILAREAPAGNIAVIQPGQQVCLGQRTVLLKPVHSIVDSDFLAYYILSPLVQKSLIGKATGSTVAHVNLSAIRPFPLLLPPLEEQKRIVVRLEELLALEREIAADGAALDDLVAAARRKILDLAVSGKLVPRQGEWKRVKGKDLFADTESRLPEGDFFDYIDIDAIDNKAHRVVSPKHLKVSDAPSRATRGVRTGDTIFSIVRPYLENIAYIDESLSHCIASTGFHVCRPRDFCDNKYLFMLMTSPYVIQGLNAFMKGDNSPSIRKNDIMNFAFPIPPLSEQKAIVKRVDELMALFDAMKG